MTPDDEDKALRAVALQNAQSILLARGKAEQDLLRAKDALEIKTAELAQSLSMLRGTLESTFDGIMVTDEAGKIVGFNETYTRMWHIPRDMLDQASHRDVLQFISKQLDDPRAFMERVEQIHATALAESLDVIELADGRVFERFSKVRAGSDGLAGRVWSFRDITQRKQAERAAREGAARLQLAVAAGRMGDWSWEAASDLVALSPQAAQLFGLSHEVPITWKTMRDLLHPEDAERARIAVEQALANFADYDIEYRVNRPSGEQVWIAATGRGTYANDGSVLGMTGIVQDISARKRVEEALEDETRILELLNETGKSIASELDLQSLLQKVTDAATAAERRTLRRVLLQRQRARTARRFCSTRCPARRARRSKRSASRAPRRSSGRRFAASV